MMSFTIITCTFNAEPVLQRTLDSVFSQTYPQVEHLIMDGASKDGTVEMVRRYERMSNESDSEHRVHLVSEPDRGLYDAMNKAIHLAENRYLLFLNAGDTFAGTDTLEQVAGMIPDGGEKPAVLYGETDIVDDAGRFLRHRRLSPPERLCWRDFKYGMLVCHQAFYVRSDLAKLTPYNLVYKYSADVDWCIRIMKEAERRHLQLLNVNAVVAHYLDGGMSVKNHRASLEERFKVMVDHYGYFTTVVMHVFFLFRSFFKL